MRWEIQTQQHNILGQLLSDKVGAIFLSTSGILCRIMWEQDSNFEVILKLKYVN